MTRQSDTTSFREAALDYYEFPTPGKIAIAPTKQMINQRDLALAYSPGVAFACEEIVENPLNAARFTARSNLVGVVTNGTAVLGAARPLHVLTASATVRRIVKIRRCWWRM